MLSAVSSLVSRKPTATIIEEGDIPDMSSRNRLFQLCLVSPMPGVFVEEKKSVGLGARNRQTGGSVYQSEQNSNSQKDLHHQPNCQPDDGCTGSGDLVAGVS